MKENVYDPLEYFCDDQEEWQPLDAEQVCCKLTDFLDTYKGLSGRRVIIVEKDGTGYSMRLKNERLETDEEERQREYGANWRNRREWDVYQELKVKWEGKDRP